MKEKWMQRLELSLPKGSPTTTLQNLLVKLGNIPDASSWLTVDGNNICDTEQSRQINATFFFAFLCGLIDNFQCRNLTMNFTELAPSVSVKGKAIKQPINIDGHRSGVPLSPPNANSNGAKKVAKPVVDNPRCQNLATPLVIPANQANIMTAPSLQTKDCALNEFHTGVDVDDIQASSSSTINPNFNKYFIDFYC